MRTSQGQTIYLKNYRAPDYRVLTVDLDINLNPEDTIIHSRLLLERQKTTSKEAAVVLDGDELELVSVAIEGKKLAESDFKLSETHLSLTNPPKKQRFEVEITTRTNPSANTKLMGLYRSGGNYCTQCEAEGFRRITYYPDRPDVLAVFTTRIEADRKEAPVLLGNGNPTKKGAAGKGRHYAIWHDPHPKPSYLFALVGGNLGSIHKPYKTSSGRKVKLGIYVEKGKEESAHYAMDSLIRSMRWDEDVFGCEYDLDVFNIVAVSDFNMGAMENKGLNIFNDKYVLADPETATDADYANIEAIVAHEYFHNWTGNRITCRDWFQLCLKEGLTVFRDQEFSADQRSRPVKRIEDVRRLKTDQFPEDAGPLAHAVRPQTYREINNFYTATVYEKGAELVRMIATILGEARFRKGMDLYLKKHDGEAATIEQFIASFEKVAKADLSQFSLWYSQAGTPSLNFSTKYDRHNRRFTLEVEQFQKATPGQRQKKPLHVPQRIGLIGKNSGDLVPTHVKGAEFSDGVLHLTKRSHTITFEGISEKPVVSLNRGFTAPVEIDYRQSNSDLGFLALNDTDGFGRWQAFQTYAIRLLANGAKAAGNGDKIQLDDAFLDIAATLAGDATLEPAFRATLLTMPSGGDIAQVMAKNVDPDAIHKSWSALNAAIGKRLEADRSRLLRSISIDGPYTPDAEQAGMRSLRSQLMRQGVIGKSKSALAQIIRDYKRAENMTDRFSALVTIVHYHPDRTAREKILKDFYARYRHNHLVVDKWFSVQASRPGSATVAAVRKLMKHEDFTLSNPNRLRSVLGVFAMANPTAFNAANGSGYKLMVDAIVRLDRINPQVAARLLTTFRSYKSLEKERRRLTEMHLKRLQSQKDLSRDVSDILDRTLSG